MNSTSTNCNTNSRSDQDNDDDDDGRSTAAEEVLRDILAQKKKKHWYSTTMKTKKMNATSTRQEAMYDVSPASYLSLPPPPPN